LFLFFFVAIAAGSAKELFFDLYDYDGWEVNMFSRRVLTPSFLSLFLSILDGGWMALESLQLAPAQIDTQVYGRLFYDFSLFFFFCRTWVGDRSM
jgi:hypothetical protein